MNLIQSRLIELLSSGEKTIALLAPSFPIDFSHPEIICALRELGFDMVSEITFGARMTNYWHVEYVKTHPDQKYFITGPCPTCLTLIEKKYPELLQYVIPYASPIVSQARIIRKELPDYKIVFFAPCQAKQLLEWPKHKKDIDLVLTFKELSQIFTDKKIDLEHFENCNEPFDTFICENTKVYPISGGLAKTALVHNLIPENQIWIGDGPANLIKIFDEIKSGSSKYRFFDILNCPGGCIGGPGLANTSKPLEEKQKVILDYRDKMNCPSCKIKEGDPVRAEGIDFMIH